MLRLYKLKHVNFEKLFLPPFLKKFRNSLSLMANFIVLVTEQIRLQELTLLSEYFLVTGIFCLVLFALFSLKFSTKTNYFSVKFLYKNQIIVLLVFIILCYLILVFQQYSFSFLSLTSFNDTINNDILSLFSKTIIGLFCVLYLLFINKFLENQKLNSFEYCILLITSTFGFFLLCCSNDLITVYLAIELQGLAFYVLAAFKKSSNFSVESGIKYFVLGSLSTALFLLGVTLIYGSSGSIILTDFQELFFWIFSASSFAFSLDSLPQVFGLCQEKSNIFEQSEYTKLKAISDKLILLGGDIELPFMKSREITEKFLKYYDESSINSTSNFFDSLKIEFANPDALTASIFLFSFNDFLIENNYQENLFVNLISTFKSSSIDSNDFLSLKNHFFESNYYETLEIFYDSASNVNTSITKNTSLWNGSDFSYDNAFLQSIESDFSSLKYIQSCFASIVQTSNLNDFFFKSFEVNYQMSPNVFDLDFIIVGVLILILALFFKLALAPFHLWSPDVYEGSPSSSTFYFMVLSKFGIFVFLLRLCYFSFYSLVHYWQFYSIIIASISILVGAVAGLKQRKLKSLLTYSSINNMGFVLLAFSVGSFEGVHMKFYYLIVYMLASVCIWSIVLNLRLKKSDLEKQNRELGDLMLMQESNPIIAQSLGVTLFSLAGLPPMVGFLAKMGVFKALGSVSVYYFSVVNILFSVIATFYYLRITKIIFFENALVGNLYVTISSKKVFIINLLTFLLIFFFFNPMFLYLYSYKITLLLSKSFF